MFGPLLRLFLTLLRCIDFMLLTFVVYIISWFPKFLSRSYIKPLFRFWSGQFVRALGVQLYAHQKYQGSLPKQFILIGNHPSALEDVGMPSIFDAHFLAKIEVKDWFIVGRISQAAGTLYVHREDKGSRAEAAKKLKEVLERGDSVGLYPEGGCKGRRIHQPFLYGAFKLSMETGVPLLPVFLHYESQHDFEWGPNEHLLLKLSRIMRSQNRRVNYYIYSPIEPSSFKSLEEFSTHVEDLYLEWQTRYLD